MTPDFKLRVASILAVALALLASCTPKETNALLEPGKALAAVLAEEAARAAGTNRKIAIITHDGKWGPPSSVEEAFKAALKKQGFSTFTAKAAYLGDPMKISQVGLQPADFFEALQNARDAGAIVSFAGAPLLTPGDAGQLKAGHPPILIVAIGDLGDQLGIRGNRAQLTGLLETKIVQLAVINGGQDPAAQTSGKTDSTHDLFAKNYRTLRAPD